MHRMVAVEACILRNSSFNRHHRSLTWAGLTPAVVGNETTESVCEESRRSQVNGIQRSQRHRFQKSGVGQHLPVDTHKLDPVEHIAGLA
jgi:hypothetical protein